MPCKLRIPVPTNQSIPSRCWYKPFGFDTRQAYNMSPPRLTRGRETPAVITAIRKTYVVEGIKQCAPIFNCRLQALRGRLFSSRCIVLRALDLDTMGVVLGENRIYSVVGARRRHIGAIIPWVAAERKRVELTVAPYIPHPCAIPRRLPPPLHRLPRPSRDRETEPPAR